MHSSELHPTRELFLNSCLKPSIVANGESCPICLQNYDLAPASANTVDEESHTLCETPSCSHQFGFSCLSAWAKQHNTCPMCRERTYQLSEEEEGLSRSMLHELMIGEGMEADEDDLYDSWSMEGYPATTNDLEDYSTDEYRSSRAADLIGVGVWRSEQNSEDEDHSLVVAVTEEEDINSTSLAQSLQSLEVAIEPGDDTDEERGDWVTEAVKEYEELQRSCRERIE